MTNNHHNESRSHHVVKTSTERSFGLVFSSVSALFAGLSLYRGGHMWVLWCPASVLFLLAGLLFPSILSLPNRLWTKLGLLLAKIVNPVAMGLIYFVVFTPIALILRLMGKDILEMKVDRAAVSYWIVRDPPGPASESMKDQF